MTRDEARAAFTSVGLNYEVLTPANVSLLRRTLSTHLRKSGLMKDSFRMHRYVRFYKPPHFAVELRCRAFYFERREAITFNSNGFIGFAGWSDEFNVQPILAAFVEWVEAVSIVQKEAA